MKTNTTETNRITKHNIMEGGDKEIILNLWHVITKAEANDDFFVIVFMGKEYEMNGMDDEKYTFLNARAFIDFNCPTVKVPVPDSYVICDCESGKTVKGLIPFAEFNAMPLNFKLRAYEPVISAIEEKSRIKISDYPLVSITPIKYEDGILTAMPIDRIVREDGKLFLI